MRARADGSADHHPVWPVRAAAPGLPKYVELAVAAYQRSSGWGQLSWQDG